jgi:hypothetical protein
VWTTEDDEIGHRASLRLGRQLILIRIKLGHCQSQIRPLRVKTGQYRQGQNHESQEAANWGGPYSAFFSFSALSIFFCASRIAAFIE